jgi:hypothetical protein
MDGMDGADDWSVLQDKSVIAVRRRRRRRRRRRGRRRRRRRRLVHINFWQVFAI